MIAVRTGPGLQRGRRPGRRRAARWSRPASRTRTRGRSVPASCTSSAPLVPNYAHLLAVAQGELGSHLLRMKRADAARKELDASLAALRTLAERYPDVPAYRFDLGRIGTSEGVALVSAGDLTGPSRRSRPPSRDSPRSPKSEPDRPDIRLALLGVYRNLIYCRDRQARQAMDRSKGRVAAGHVAQLLALRKKYEQALPKAADGTPWAEQARLWWRAPDDALRADPHAPRPGQRPRGRRLVPGHGPGDGGPPAARRCDLAGQPPLRRDALAGDGAGAGRAPDLAADYGKKALALLGPLAASGLPNAGRTARRGRLRRRCGRRTPRRSKGCASGGRRARK